MAPELSSNWKRLQSTLEKESKTSKEAKAKKIPTERQRNSLAKRKRLEAKKALSETSDKNILDSNKRRKMGAGGSTTESAAPSASLALWAEDNDISSTDLALAYGNSSKDVEIRSADKDKINEGLAGGVDIGKYVAIDCEMVGVGGEEDRSVLARVSIVNFHGEQVYDSFVKPKEFVTDWRTHVSGVSPRNMATARSFDEVQKEVGEILEGRILIGHAIKNDLEAMMLTHSKREIRDTSRFSGFRKYSAGRTPGLKKLAKEVLGVDIQGGEHSSIEDARATMLLFRRHKSAFDIEHAQRFPQRNINGEGPSKPKKKKKSKK